MPHQPQPRALASSGVGGTAASPSPPSQPVPSFDPSSSTVRSTCFSCPPVLAVPGPPTPARPHSAKSGRPRQWTAPAPGQGRPSTAPPSLPSAPFRIPSAPRPPSPRSSQPRTLLAWTSSSSSSSSCTPSTPSTPPVSSSPTSALYRSCTSTFFLSSPHCHPRAASTWSDHYLTSSSQSFPSPPSPPSPSCLSYHHVRYQADYSFHRSYTNLFPASSTLTYHTSTRTFHSPPPPSTSPRVDDLIGKWKPVRGNGNQIIDPVVRHSKFRTPVFQQT